MNAVRSCLTAVAAVVVVLLLVAAIGSRAIVSAAVCCTASGLGDVCLNGNRTFHAIETIGDGPCDDNVTAVPIRKCCPPDRTYDTESRFCRPADANASAVASAFRRLLDLDRPQQITTTVGYDYEPPKCVSGDVLVDVPADEVRQLLLISPDNETDADRTPRVGFLSRSYCFDVTASGDRLLPRLVARTCRPRRQHCRERYTCVNKCCKGDRMIVGSGCKKSTVPFQLPIYDVRDNGGGDDTLVPSSNRTLLPYYERLKCVDRDQQLDFNVTANGSLLYYRPSDNDPSGDRRRQLVAATDYCLEFVAATAADTPRPEAYTCAEIVASSPANRDEQDKQGSWKYFVILAGFVPSIVCLVFTLLVYAALPSLRNVHGYNVMCYVACLLVSFVCLLVIQWMTDAINHTTCKLFGYATLFAFFTTFCWLNVICFDIYWMLRYNNSINRNASLSIRTVLYHVYCWGFSSIYTFTGFSFQHSKNVALLNLAPDIGTGSCWFSKTDYGTVIFFLIPVSTMLLVNLILFVLTAIHCSRIKSELNKFKRNDAKNERFQVDKEKFVMSIKLFLVMGIPWSFEILSKVFNNDWFIWHVLDEINALQGVMIFMIFVAKRKVLTNLRKKITSSLDNSESTKVNTISMSVHSNSTQKYNNDF